VPIDSTAVLNRRPATRRCEHAVELCQQRAVGRVFKDILDLGRAAAVNDGGYGEAVVVSRARGVFAKVQVVEGVDLGFCGVGMLLLTSTGIPRFFSSFSRNVWYIAVRSDICCWSKLK
jgi:hypothetical protein